MKTINNQQVIDSINSKGNVMYSENFVMGCVKEQLHYRIVKGDGWATMHVDGFIPNKVEEQKPTKQYHRGDSMQASDFGPQRFAIPKPKYFDYELGRWFMNEECQHPTLDFIETELSDNDDPSMDIGYYACTSCGTVLTKEETYSKMSSRKFSCKTLSKDDAAWLKANKAMFSQEELNTYMQINEEDEDEVTLEKQLEYKDEQMTTKRYNDLNNAPTTLENTGMCYEELLFWRKMVWYIGHSPKGALRICKDMSSEEWFTQEKKQYVWELIKDDETPKWKWIKVLMMKAKGIVKQIGGASASSVPPKATKVFNVHVFYSTDKLKEGFINYWAVDGKTIKGFHRTSFMNKKTAKEVKNSSTGALMGKLVKRAIDAGYRVEYVDVSSMCLKLFGRTPNYSKARTNDAASYVSGGFKALM